MSERDDGEPAFLHDRGGPYKDMWSGISVRDYFAAKAMTALLTAMSSGDSTPITRAMSKAKVETPEELFARNAYQMADAMLKERAK